MTRTDLLKQYADLNNPDTYSKDYVEKFLVKHWQDESKKRNWEELVTTNFADRHAVDGKLSVEKAVDICRQRSGQGAHDFTSTTLTTDFVQNIVRFVADDIIAWHGKNRGNFTNYEISVRGMMITVKYDASKKAFLPTQYNDKVVVGINREGLINHFHGDAQYAEGSIYRKDGNNIIKIRD
jgi:hypothetical protein